MSSLAVISSYQADSISATETTNAVEQVQAGHSSSESGMVSSEVKQLPQSSGLGEISNPQLSGVLSVNPDALMKSTICSELDVIDEAYIAELVNDTIRLLLKSHPESKYLCYWSDKPHVRIAIHGLLLVFSCMSSRDRLVPCYPGSGAKRCNKGSKCPYMISLCMFQKDAYDCNEASALKEATGLGDASSSLFQIEAEINKGIPGCGFYHSKEEVNAVRLAVWDHLKNNHSSDPVLLLRNPKETFHTRTMGTLNQALSLTNRYFRNVVCSPNGVFIPQKESAKSQSTEASILIPSPKSAFSKVNQTSSSTSKSLGQSLRGSPPSYRLTASSESNNQKSSGVSSGNNERTMPGQGQFPKKVIPVYSYVTNQMSYAPVFHSDDRIFDKRPNAIENKEANFPGLC